MKFYILALVTLLVLGGFVALVPTASGEEDDQQKRVREMREAEARAGKLGPQHEALGYYVGTWDVTSRLTMPHVDSDASPGTVTFAWLYDGRWLEQRFEGVLLGTTMKSYGLTGYDVFRGKYVQTFVDDQSTRMVRAEGVVSDPAGKTMVLYGEMDEPSMGVSDKAFKLVRRITGDDTFVQEVWDLGIGPSGMKVMEMTFNRRK